MITIEKRTKMLSIVLITFLTLTFFGNNLVSSQNSDSLSFQAHDNCDRSKLFSSESNDIRAPKLNYDPVLDLTGAGDTINCQDELSVFHHETLTIPAAGSDNYNIDSVHDYSDKDLTYNMTVRSSEDFYLIGDNDIKDQKFDSSHLIIAQSFEVIWNYVVFSGAKIFLDTSGSSLGDDEVELYIVSSLGTGYPNMSDVLSSEINGPYSDSNPIPASSSGNFAYYNFSNAVLSQGKYYVVIEQVSNTGGDDFVWWADDNTDDYDTYYYDGSWNDETWDFNLLVELVETDIAGDPKVYTTPGSISLQDNSIDVTSFTQAISSTGTHTLSANTSVDITLNNSYVFERTIIASTSFQAVNSTFMDYSVSWDLNLYTSEFTHSPYLLPSRVLKISLPSNWNKSTPNFLLNGSIHISTQETSYGFFVDLNQILSGVTYQNYDMTFECSSPNYLFDIALNDDSFDLGYWTTNGSHAIGYNGSTINSDAFVREQVGIGATDGEFNFTLYDPNGDIVALKTNPPSNISFTDHTEYTILETTQASPGRYSVSTIFDPSIYGTDIEGYWTVSYFWNNGTEVGFFTKRIEVRKSTQALFEWETQPNNEIWTSDNLQEITRIQGEILRVKISYYNTSDPFFSGLGVPIHSAPVEYSTEWGSSGLLNYVGPYYQSSILVNAVEANYTIILNATGNLLQSHSESFSVRIYHTFGIDTISNIDVYYKDDTVFEFSVIDISNSSTTILPDSMVFTLEGFTLTPVLEYSTRILGNNIELTVFTDSDSLDLSVGTYSIEISVTKKNFLVSYGQNNATAIVMLSINPTLTEIQNIMYETEVDLTNQSTVLTVISFNYVDITHSENISGAIVSVDLDLVDASIKQSYETNGLYTIEIKINKTEEPSLHVTLTISADGYETITDLPLATILINDSTIPGGIPNYLYIIIGIFGAAIAITPLIVIIRRKLTKEKRIQKALFNRIYGLYESVLSITKLIIVHKATGLPVYEMDLGSEIMLDPSLITGFLTAISSMGVELKGDRVGGVKRLQYKNFLVTGSESDQFTLYTFSETELNEEIEESLTTISDWFAMMFNQIDVKWDGSTEIFRINLQGITEKIMKEIHLWIFYPFIVSPLKSHEIDELNGIEKRIMDYIINNENVTMSRVFDDMDDIKLERGLPILFDFIERGLITPVFDAYKIATVRF